MPTQTRSRGKPSAASTLRSTSAAPRQQEFSHRRRSVKTYGRSKPAPKLKQETLTQMDFTSSAMPDFTNPLDEEGEDGEDEEAANMGIDPPKPMEKAKPKAKSRSSRRKTAGDEVDAEENPRRSKRRKTLGDSPTSNISGSFHTQTLTQMMSTNAGDGDLSQIEDSQDDENSKISVETPRKSSGYRSKIEPQEGIGSAVPSLIQSATPVNRQKKTEIPSSQSPATPMLLRYSPALSHSPLLTKSTNLAAHSPILKNPQKTPRNVVVPDSYSTLHKSSPIASQKSTVKATPSKQLRFDLPDNKENITPGRTKRKSPRPRTGSTGRQPLQEVPDSDEEQDEDSDETEYETEDEDDEANDPESPTPKRFRNIAPPAENPEPELGPTEVARCPSTESVLEPVLYDEDELANHEPGDRIAAEPEHASPASHNSTLDGRRFRTEQPKSIIKSQEPGQIGDPDAGTEATAEKPASHRAEQDTIDPDSASASKRAIEPALSEQIEHDSTTDDQSPSQDFFYTQGLESQRLPLDSIRALGPQTLHSDIMVSLHPEHIARIVDRTKNHEFRAWKIPHQVSRVWVYVTKPESQLKYMCIFGEPKNPGEIQDESGIGNADFNQGKKAVKFAYEILQVYELNNPVSLDEMKKKGWVAGAPQKYTHIPPAVVGELTANLRCALFEDTPLSESSLPKGVTESQELKAQLQNDADYSTQHFSGTADEVIPASQSPRRNDTKPKAVVDEEAFVKPALSEVRSIPSNHESPSLPDQRRRNFVRPSQATTVSQLSSSPAISPSKQSSRPIATSSPSRNGSPTTLRRIHSSLRSSQFPTSQLLPDSLLNDDIQEPPPIIWDSADEHTD